MPPPRPPPPQAYEEYEADEARKDLQLAKQQARAKQAAGKRAKQVAKPKGKGKRHDWSGSESEASLSDSGARVRWQRRHLLGGVARGVWDATRGDQCLRTCLVSAPRRGG